MKLFYLIVVCAALAINADWSSFGANGARSGYSPNYLPNIGQAMVSMTADLAIKAGAAPVLANGKIYTYSATASNGCIRCFDQITLAQEWSAPVAMADYGYGSWGSLSIADDKIVYAADAFLAAWNLDGTPSWQISMEHQTVNSSPLVVNNRIYIGAFSYLNEEGGIGCYDLNSGSQLWFNATINNSTFSSCSPASDGTYGYACASNQVWKFDLNTGDPIWLTTLPGHGLNNLSVAANGTVLVVNYDYMYAAENLFACDANGNLIWSAATGQSDVAPAIIQNDNYNICIHSCGDSGVTPSLTAFDLATGAKLWTVDGAGSLNSAPAVANDVVYAATPLFSGWSFIGVSNFVGYSIADGTKLSDAVVGGNTPAIGENAIFSVDNGILYSYTWEFTPVVVKKFNAKISLPKPGKLAKDGIKLSGSVVMPETPTWLNGSQTIKLVLGDVELLPVLAEYKVADKLPKKISCSYLSPDKAIKVSLKWSAKSANIKIKASIKKSTLDSLLDFESSEAQIVLPITLSAGEFYAKSNMSASYTEKKGTVKIKK